MSEQNVIIRSHYSPKVKVYAPYKKDGRTAQYEKDKTDIVNILQKYSTQGTLTVNALEPQFGDFSQVVTYQDALDAKIKTEAAFQGLPSIVRNQFNNSPKQLIAFMNDPKNKKAAQKIGLIDPDPVEIIRKPAVQPVTEPDPAPAT